MTLPASQRRYVMADNDQIMAGSNPAHAYENVQTLTGLDVQCFNKFRCIQKDGSGYYVVRTLEGEGGDGIHGGHNWFVDPQDTHQIARSLIVDMKSEYGLYKNLHALDTMNSAAL